MFCKYCGKQVDSDASFCASCGRKIKLECEVEEQGEELEKIVSKEPTQPSEGSHRSVTFSEAIKQYYIHFSDFSGRAVRSEYWFAYLYNTLAAIVLVLLSFPFWVSCIWSVVHLVPGITVTVRRLHDTGRSGAYWWLGLIPIAGPFIMLYFVCCGSDGDNQWGLSPCITSENIKEQEQPAGEHSEDMTDAVHAWKCDCGATVSVSPCCFCGRNRIDTFTEQGLKDYLLYEIKACKQEAHVLDFYRTYMDCVYGDSEKEQVVELLKIMFDKGPDLIDFRYVLIMIEGCERRLSELGLWRCRGCGEIVPLSVKACSCGYKRTNESDL